MTLTQSELELVKAKGLEALLLSGDQTKVMFGKLLATGVSEKIEAFMRENGDDVEKASDVIYAVIRLSSACVAAYCAIHIEPPDKEASDKFAKDTAGLARGQFYSDMMKTLEGIRGLSNTEILSKVEEIIEATKGK